MKKRSVYFIAILLAGLVACGGPEVEITPTPEPSPSVLPTKNITVPTAPAVEVTLAVETPEPSPEVTAPPPTPPVTPAPTPKPIPAPTPTPIPTPEPTPQVIATPEPIPPEEMKPSDEEVLAAYQAAEEAYGWFTGFFEWSDDFLDQEDIEKRPGPGEMELDYSRVIRPGLESMDGLRNHLKRLFSDEIIDPLLAKDLEVPHFIETEKGLYILCAGVGGGLSDKGAVTSMTVLWPEGETPVGCIVRVTQEKLEWNPENGEPMVNGEWVYEFPYQKVGDKWIFTHFESIF